MWIVKNVIHKIDTNKTFPGNVRLIRQEDQIILCKLSCDIWDRKIRHDACGLNISCVSLFFIPVSSLFLTASFVPGRVQMTIFNVFLQFDVATSFVGRVSQIWDVIAWVLLQNSRETDLNCDLKSINQSSIPSVSHYQAWLWLFRAMRNFWAPVKKNLKMLKTADGHPPASIVLTIVLTRLFTMLEQEIFQ